MAARKNAVFHRQAEVDEKNKEKEGGKKGRNKYLNPTFCIIPEPSGSAE